MSGEARRVATWRQTLGAVVLLLGLFALGWWNWRAPVLRFAYAPLNALALLAVFLPLPNDPVKAAALTWSRASRSTSRRRAAGCGLRAAAVLRTM